MIATRSMVSLSRFLKTSGLIPSCPGALLLPKDLNALSTIAAVNFLLFLSNVNSVGLFPSVFSFSGCCIFFSFWFLFFYFGCLFLFFRQI